MDSRLKLLVLLALLQLAFSTSDFYKHIALSDNVPSDDFIGTYYRIKWANYDSDDFDDDNDADLETDSDDKIIYRIMNDEVHYETGYELRYKSLAFDRNMKNAKGKYYVAWDIDVDLNFCDVVGDDTSGNGTGYAKIKFFHCLEAAEIFFHYVKYKICNTAAVIMRDESPEAYIYEGTNSNFCNESQLSGFFFGTFLSQTIKVCSSCA